MRTISYYECEFCGNTYESEEEALACEVRCLSKYANEHIPNIHLYDSDGNSISIEKFIARYPDSWIKPLITETFAFVIDDKLDALGWLDDVAEKQGYTELAPWDECQLGRYSIGYYEDCTWYPITSEKPPCVVAYLKAIELGIKLG